MEFGWLLFWLDEPTYCYCTKLPESLTCDQTLGKSFQTTSTKLGTDLQPIWVWLIYLFMHFIYYYILFVHSFCKYVFFIYLFMHLFSYLFINFCIYLFRCLLMLFCIYLFRHLLKHSRIYLFLNCIILQLCTLFCIYLYLHFFFIYAFTGFVNNIDMYK